MQNSADFSAVSSIVSDVINIDGLDTSYRPSEVYKRHAVELGFSDVLVRDVFFENGFVMTPTCFFADEDAANGGLYNAIVSLNMLGIRVSFRDNLSVVDAYEALYKAIYESNLYVPNGGLRIEV